MPVTLSAASRLRERVLEVPGMVLLCAAGHPDRIIRFQVIPESLKEFKKDGKNYIFINMDRGPDQEAWRDAMDVTRRTARRDRPIPDPVEVAKDSHEDWSIGEEDVPVIENAIEVVTVATPREEAKVEKKSNLVACDVCGKKYNAGFGLSVHKRKHKGV